MSESTPCLRADLSIVAQVYRGETSYVVKDAAAQKYFRFGAAQMRVMRSFDGRSTPSQIAAALAADGVRVSARAVDAFARQLSEAGFLERSLAERSTLQVERLRAERNRRRQPKLFRGEILRMRWSFGDPDALLTQSLPYMRWLFARPAIATCAALFVLYLGLLAGRWTEFKTALGATYSLHAITLGDVVTLWVVGGLVILIHELGHAYACKYFGGEVRELGFMLVYFQPAFYCNVSDAWSFPDRRARLWVTAAGTWIQLVVASLAAVVWWAAVPGSMVARIALAAMLVGGATTIFTNANPLLPLDGYFALTDWLEIPNLRHRALAYFGWWVQRRVLRLDLPEPAASVRERRVFLIYGSLAFVYTSTLLAIVAWLVMRWSGRALGLLGIVLALGGILALLRQRIAAWVRAVSLVARSRRAWLQTLRRRVAFGGVVVLAAMMAIPWTIESTGSFVARPVSAHAAVAPDSGVVAQVFVAEGQHVGAGTPLVRLVDRERERELLAAGRAIDSLTISESAARSSGRDAEADRLNAERSAAVANLSALERRVDALTLRSISAGTVVTARPEELVGRRVGAGDSLLAVATLDSVELRVALAGAGATRVRQSSVAHVVSFADVAHPWTAPVGAVSAAGIASGSMRRGVEARIRVAASDAWRPGIAGEASIEIGRSNLAGALLWKLRQLVRADLWL